MSNRADTSNTSGATTYSGGNMPANTHAHQQAVVSRVNGRNAAPVVVSNNHAVELDSDGGVWDTVSGVAVARDKTNLDCANL